MENIAVRGLWPLRVGKYLSCIRYREIFVMQGAPVLGAAFALGNAIPQKLGTLVVFVCASVLLVAHIFALNDWAGVGADMNDPNKAPGVCLTKGVSRGQILLLSIMLLAFSLLLFGILSERAFLLASSIAALGLLYSAPAVQAKGVPFLSSLTHLVEGSCISCSATRCLRPSTALGRESRCFLRSPSPPDTSLRKRRITTGTV